MDISFRCVIRLTAGMDRVVQAAGRCNRNAQSELAPVYVVTLLDENLSRLEEIRRAREATLTLLSAYHREPEQFDFDLASDAAIAYYNRFYGAMPGGAQDYRLPAERTSMFALLSDNRDYWKPLCRGFMLNQAFRTAGDAFTVFDSDTQDVVVPYGAGGELIEELAARERIDVAFLAQWVSRAKPYTISLYTYQLRTLADVIAEYEGVKVLPPEYYDARIGFTIKTRKFDFLEA